MGDLLKAGLNGSIAISDIVWQISRNLDLAPSTMALAGIEQVLGDFTSLRLIPCLDTGDPLPELARRVQTELADAADDPAADTTALQRRAKVPGEGVEGHADDRPAGPEDWPAAGAPGRRLVRGRAQ